MTISAPNSLSQTISPRKLAQMLHTATDWLGVHREQVDALNVYPVPDGDTGTNMHLTMQSVRRALDEADQGDLRAVAQAIAHGALMGARGNSGVILSQILRGFAEELQSSAAKTDGQVSASSLRRALEAAQKAGYGAVSEPVEGTILTVARAIAEGSAAVRGETAHEVLEGAIARGQEVLEKTREMLPALRDAGVVDSGGQGLVYLLRGMLAGLRGEALPPAPKVERRAQAHMTAEEYGYCTEFLLEDARLSAAELRELVAPFGDSLLVVDLPQATGTSGWAGTLVKGHIHTDRPDELLALVGRYGQMLKTKVEDMAQQHHEILDGMQGGATEVARPALGMVAVADGDGIVRQFRALGARIVAGGQTANPSVQDIVDAVGSLGAEQVIILPNNKNVLLAAQKAADLLAGRARVVPTISPMQGLGAALASGLGMGLQGGTPDPEAVAAQMQEAAQRITTLEITHASRDTMLDVSGERVEVKKGDVIGLRDDKLVHTGGTPEAAALDMLQAALKDNDEAEVLTVFYNTAASERAAELVEAIEAAHPLLDVDAQAGGPELYAYVLGLE